MHAQVATTTLPSKLLDIWDIFLNHMFTFWERGGSPIQPDETMPEKPRAQVTPKSFVCLTACRGSSTPVSMLHHGLEPREARVPAWCQKTRCFGRREEGALLDHPRISAQDLAAHCVPSDIRLFPESIAKGSSGKSFEH